MPRSVTVQLKSGVTRAILPDNRVMVQGQTYVISYDDWLSIAAAAKAKVIDLVSFNEDLRSVEGIDLTTNTSSLPTYTVGGNTYTRRLGQVTYGYAGEAFRLVRLVDAVNADAGYVACWVSKSANTVTVDRAGGSSWSEFAGVFVSAVTAGNYGWIQTAGATASTVLADAAISAGQAVEVSSTVDGAAAVAGANSTTRFGVALTTASGTPLKFSLSIENYGRRPNRRPKQNIFVR